MGRSGSPIRAAEAPSYCYLLPTFVTQVHLLCKPASVETKSMEDFWH